MGPATGPELKGPNRPGVEEPRPTSIPRLLPSNPLTSISLRPSPSGSHNGPTPSVTPPGCAPAFSVPRIELKATVGSTTGRTSRLNDRSDVQRIRAEVHDVDAEEDEGVGIERRGHMDVERVRRDDLVDEVARALRRDRLSASGRAPDRRRVRLAKGAIGAACAGVLVPTPRRSAPRSARMANDRVMCISP